MKTKKMRRVLAFLLCAAFLLQNYEVKAAIELFAQGTEWDGEAAIYWNPGETLLSYGEESDLATRSNTVNKARKGSDRANGLSPDAAVKSFSTALGRAEKLSRRMEIDLTDVVIYAMNPMVISQGKSVVVNGKEVTVVPWDGDGEEQKPIFIVDGGTLSLNNITLQSEYDEISEELVLVYASSGKIQIGEQVEVYGSFLLDYTYLESDWSVSTASNANSYMATASDANSQPKDVDQEPVIELTNWFDFVEGSYTLELRIPEDREDDVIAIKTLHASQMSEEDFLEAFTINGTTEDWEILAEGRVDGIFRDTTPIEQDTDLIFSEASPSDASLSDANESNIGQRSKRSITSDEPEIELTQKNLIARRVGGVIQGSKISGRLWLDRNSNGIMEESERPIPDYNVSLFAANDRTTPVLTVKTQADGSYQFENLAAGSYVVGIVSEVIGSREYLLPQVGIVNDNKFEKTEIVKVSSRMAAATEETVATAYSEMVTIAAAAAVPEALNAGLKMGASLANYDPEFMYRPLGGHTLRSGDETKLVVMAAVEDPATGYYKSYTANTAGLREALYDLYDEGIAEANYIMYLGASFSVDANSADIMFSALTTVTEASKVSFASLSERLNTLVITGLRTDDVTDTAPTGAPTACNQLTVEGSGSRYFGSNIILRNIRHTINAGTGGTNGIYMNGYDLTLGGNSWQGTGARYFGGGSSGTVTPSDGTASITVYSTGSGDSYFVGGMRTGTLDGNTEITIKDTCGNLIRVWGGGLGTSSTARANVTGNITNTITGIATTGIYGLWSFTGGVEYGDVDGRITNTISGKGRLYSCNFYGGSANGNIGTEAAPAQDITALSDVDMDDYIIKNYIDFGEYSAGATNYYGTNSVTGIVKGNVINIVKAGEYNRGSVYSYAGGLGYTDNWSNYVVMGDGAAGWHRSFNVDATTAKVTEAGIENGLAAAKAISKYQHYGNLVNNIRSGSISSLDFWRAVGWGYMEGNAYSEVGTEEIAYKAGNKGYSYGSNINTQGQAAALDFVGGGGNVADNMLHGGFCIKGNTTLVIREVLARYTYGGSYGGVQIGDSKISHHGGVVDTCEGTGYLSYLHVGDGRAEVHGGQVDWFLSGGGWGDTYQHGDVSVEVYDNKGIIINASMGGTYGRGEYQRISGDATVVVRGGDFSGTARTEVFQGFSAGPSYAGYILGNASVTLDLRGNQNGFKIGSNDNISGGRRWNASTASYLGTDATNTITLNIFTDDSNTDLLNGLNIYGDCALDPDYRNRTRSGKITINVNAPGAKIGNLYATSYPNLTQTGTARLLRDVEINLVSVDTLTGLRCGNGSENITNTFAAESNTAGKEAVINVGPKSTDPDDELGEKEVGEPADGLPHRINISTYGIAGFTSMNIQKRLLVAQSNTGHIKNASGATLTTHGSTYNEVGALTLYAGEGVNASGLGISAVDALFIAGPAEVKGEGEVYIQSTGTSDRVILTDLVIPDTSVVTWLKVGDVAAKTNLQTNWFGVSSGWQVITLSPDKTKAYERITPINFRGLETSTGKAFIGDSDTHFTTNYGYAVAILGSNYTWKVVDGDGTISHNVPVSTTAPTPGNTILAYGTVLKDTPSTSGRLSIPSQFMPDKVGYPEFTFKPDIALDECVDYVNIYGSDRYISPAPHNYYISRGEMYQPKSWNAKDIDAEYSFDITASFEKGDISVYGRNVIITETEAMAINSADEVIAYTQASGTPIFKSNITDELLAEITAPLTAGQIYRPHQVTYRAVNNDDAGKTLTVTVVVVKDETVIIKDDTVVSRDRQYGVYANGASMVLDDARALSGQAALDSGYTNAVAILADGTTAVPVIDENAIDNITGTTAAECPKTVSVTYTYAPDAQSAPVSTIVKVLIQNQSKIAVSKEVKGDYIDKTTEFSFTIYFWDSSGTPLAAGTQLTYTGSVLAGLGATAPAGGTLILDGESKAVFELKHGQQVTIETTQLNGKIQIVEGENSHYKTTHIISGSTATIDERDTNVIQLGTADIAIDFINTRIRTAVYISGISGDDGNSGFVPTKPVKTLKKAYELLEEIGSNVIYVVGAIPITEDITITAAGYTSSTETVTLSGAPAQVDIRRFAMPIVGDSRNTDLYDVRYSKSDFRGMLFIVRDGAELTIGDGINVDGHFFPKTGAEYTNEFTVDREVEVLSPLVQVESGGELILQEGAKLKDNCNLKKEIAIGESRTEGGAIHNSGTVKLNGAEISGNSALRGAGIFQNGVFEIISNPDGIENQEIYLTAVKSGTTEEPVWKDHIITTAVWLDPDLKLSVNMDHAVAGRPVARYTEHENVDPQWENYTLGATVPETLFLVQHATDNNLLELQNWQIMNISVPSEIYLVVQQGKFGDIGVKRADSSDFALGSPTYLIKNGSSYETKVFLTGFVNKNTEAGIAAYDVMKLVPSALEAASDTAEKTDLYLAIEGTDGGDGSFSTLLETSLHDFNVEGDKEQELGVLEGMKEGGFEFIGTASEKFIAYYLDSSFPFFGASATAENRIAHLRNKDLATGETSANNAKALFKMTYRVEMVR